ncbi:MAG TPA: hypothetical protein DEU93_01010 [Chitinophagaceae bacterium]|nr:hypothetical protein [Chitinophagaceae bacterium]
MMLLKIISILLRGLVLKEKLYYDHKDHKEDNLRAVCVIDKIVIIMIKLRVLCVKRKNSL